MFWQKIFFINEIIGVVSLSIDFFNFRILYVGMWDYLCLFWSIWSGGEGFGFYCFIDGGLNWEKLGEGLFEEMGKVGVCVVFFNLVKVYVVIEVENGGVYCFEDRGEYWELVNNQWVIVAWAWYYIKIIVDFIDEEIVYVFNVFLLKFNNGGKDFISIFNLYIDQYFLWINLCNLEIMVLGNDGGVIVIFNGGKIWFF